MEERAILHSDLNSFYASVEMMLDPSLRGKAVAVCGSTEDRHGIVLAKSDLAKKAGVKTGMVNWEARQLCRNLIIVPPQYDQYLKYSKLTQSIYQRSSFSGFGEFVIRISFLVWTFLLPSDNDSNAFLRLVRTCAKSVLLLTIAFA